MAPSSDRRTRGYAAPPDSAVQVLRYSEINVFRPIPESQWKRLRQPGLLKPMHDPAQTIKALKGESFNAHYFYLPPLGTGRIHTKVVVQSDQMRQKVLVWAGKLLAAKLDALFGSENVRLIPAPSSKSTSAEKVLRATPGLIAESICGARSGNTTVLAAIWNRRELLSAHSEGGTRKADELYPELVGIADAPEHRGLTVLVDDVVTGGGHLVAYQRALAARAFDVRYAVCVGHTIDDVSMLGAPFEWRVRSVP